MSRIISFGLPDFKSVTVLVGRGQIVLCTCNVDFSWIRNLVCLHLLGGALLHSRRTNCWDQPILSGGSGDLAICGQSREGNRTDETDLHENLGGAAGAEGEEENHCTGGGGGRAGEIRTGESRRVSGYDSELMRMAGSCKGSSAGWASRSQRAFLLLPYFDTFFAEEEMKFWHLSKNSCSFSIYWSLIASC